MKRWWIALGVVAVLAVTLVAVWLLVLRDTATPLTADDLGFAGTAGDSPGEAGIYVYETAGFEQVDALGGARHEYPVETFLVIEQGPCGPVVRWQALDERWEEWEHCGPALAVTTSTAYHEWFSIPNRETATCVDAAIFPPPGATTWTGVCTREGAAFTQVATLVGMETLQIGGTDVDTMHIRIVETTEGSTVGTTTIDVWRLPGTPLVVRKQLDDASANASRIGDIHYVEQVTLQLKALLPTG